jgi:hypothetical protein
MLERMVAAYPYDGVVWRRLGTAYYNTDAFAKAAKAFEKAVEFGVPSYTYAAAATAARAYAHAGDADRAVHWLKAAIEDYRIIEPDKLLAEEVFNPLHDHPGYIALAQRRQGNPAASREEKWRTDIDFYMSEVRRIKPGLPAEIFDKMRAAAEALKLRIPTLSDPDLALGLSAVGALQKQGHNGFIGWGNAVGSRISPITYYLFSDGLYVVDADPAHKRLIGARVLTVGDKPLEEVARRIGTMIGDDNDMATMMWLPRKLTQPAMIHAAGISATPDSWAVKLRMPNGRELTERLRSTDPTPDFGPGSNRQELPLVATPGPVPLYLKDRDATFWMEDLPENALYVQVNRVRGTQKQTLSGFAQDLAKRLQAHPTDTLILDLRHNIGGDTYRYRDLLRTLVAYDMQENSQIYLIISRHTQSAAVNLATEVDRLTDSVVVGEPFTGRPMAPGDPVEVVLPNSRVSAGISSTVWALSGPADTRLWVAPTLPVSMASTDYFLNRDPILDAIREDMKRRRVAGTGK